MLDRKFEFYVNDPPWGQVESSQIQNLGPSKTKMICLITLCFNHIIGLHMLFVGRILLDSSLE